MKKAVSFLLAVIMAVGTFGLCAGAENVVTVDIASAKAAILTEISTGTALCGFNADERMSIASITKIMTLILTAEAIEEGILSFSDTAVCSAHAASMDGSVIWLEEGEKMSIGELVKSVVIASANDACVMLAEHISGSETEFVRLMNEKAAVLGLKNTHFANCVGYDDPEHYSTARDVAVMAAELRKYDIFDEFISTRLDSVRTGTPRETQLLNTNKLITSYKGITGLKTGTTDGAGCCFAATAKRGNTELCAVVLGCSSDTDRFSAAKNLLDHGFDNYEKVTPRPDVGELYEIPVEKGVKKGVDTRFSGISEVILPKSQAASLKYNYSRAGKVEAPVKKGQILGYVTVSSENKIISTAKIVAAESIDRLDLVKCLEYCLKEFFRF